MRRTCLSRAACQSIYVFRFLHSAQLADVEVLLTQLAHNLLAEVVVPNGVVCCSRPPFPLVAERVPTDDEHGSALVLQLDNFWSGLVSAGLVVPRAALHAQRTRISRRACCRGCRLGRGVA
eukprot:8399506-Pyramimonas_sp.AAC.1